MTVMKAFPRVDSAHGFSLVELMVAMAISMILLMSIASVFSTSIATRETIDREGRKIENARYSIDTLAEDIRLAGYYGNYSPPVTGANPADWKYVGPCDVTGGSPLPGWNATTTPVQVPFAIFGYEAHGAGALPAGLTGCLDNYRTGTDVLVVRRASTTSLAAGGAAWVPGEAYLQVSSCPDGTIDTQPFHAKATTTSADFNLHVLGCVSTTYAVVRKLITRIYYISNCDDCVNDLDNNLATTGDGIPTLKVVELAIPASGGTVLKVIENLRTIAPGIENLHIEYGIDTDDNGSIDAWVASNDDPRHPDPSNLPNLTGTAVSGMRPDAGDGNRWEDVMAVKLFLISRDLTSTPGYTDTKSFTLGGTTVAAAGDAFHRRMTATTVKAVNMSGRREAP